MAVMHVGLACQCSPEIRIKVGAGECRTPSHRVDNISVVIVWRKDERLQE